MLLYLPPYDVDSSINPPYDVLRFELVYSSVYLSLSVVLQDDPQRLLFRSVFRHVSQLLEQHKLPAFIRSEYFTKVLILLVSKQENQYISLSPLYGTAITLDWPRAVV